MCALSAKEIGYLEDHFIESVTEDWRYFRFSPWTILRLGVCLMCEPASHASHASQSASHASHAKGKN